MTKNLLFEPLTIKGVRLANRFVMPGMQRGMALNGEPTPAMAENYRRCAAGGVSLVISESTAPPHPSADWKPMFCRLDRQTLGGWRRIVDAVKSVGSSFIVQLWHPGAIREVEPGYTSAKQPTISPSGLIQEGVRNGDAMTCQDLQDVRDAFVEASALAREAGADGVEVHACHGYLLDQFLWLQTNRRTDEYGGETAAERARYPAEIVAAIRAEIGPDMPISFRFSQFKEVDYGARICETPAELSSMLGVLRGAGVDIFHASARRFYRPAWPDDPRSLAAWTKALTDTVVIAAGSVGLSTDILENLYDDRTPSGEVEASIRLIRQALDRGDFDLIAVGRSLIADPEFVHKVRNQRFSEIPVFTKSMLGSAVEEVSDSIIPKTRVIVEEQ